MPRARSPLAIAVVPAFLLGCGGAGKPAAPAAPAVPAAMARAAPPAAKAAAAPGEPSRNPSIGSAPAAPAPQPAPITGEQAEAIVWNLPETKAWTDAIARRSHGTAHATTMVLPEDPEIVAGKRYWSVNFYETQPDHIHRWQTFMVRLDGKEILVEADTGDHLSLQDWRVKQQPPARAGDAKPK